MDKKYSPFLGVGVLLIILVVVFFASKLGGGQTTTGSQSKTAYDTSFPLPSSIQNFMKVNGDRAINFQTTLSIKASEEFYRAELVKLNLKERTINTSVTATTFSMVFDGYEGEKSVVVQGVDLSGKTNINVRLEKL